MKKFWFRTKMVWYMFLAIILVPVAILLETAFAFWEATRSIFQQCGFIVAHLSKLIAAGEAPAEEVQQ